MIAALRDVSYAYPGAATRALDDVSLRLPGRRIHARRGTLGGRQVHAPALFNGLVPQFHGGHLAGAITVAGLDPSRTPTRRMAIIAGLVFQEPEAQAVAESVEDEVAFGMEQHGVSPGEMRRRIDTLLPALGIEALRLPAAGYPLRRRTPARGHRSGARAPAADAPAR